MRVFDRSLLGVEYMRSLGWVDGQASLDVLVEMGDLRDLLGDLGFWLGEFFGKKIVSCF